MGRRGFLKAVKCECGRGHRVDGNFIVDVHPELDNGWLAGAGSAEAFKFVRGSSRRLHRSPVLGDDIEQFGA